MNYLYIFIWSKKKLNYYGKKHTNTCVMYTYTLHNICRNVLANSLDSRMSKILPFLLTILRSIFKGNPVTSLTGVNGSPNPLTIPGSGTTVFPLPGSFPWAAGARGKCKIIFLKFYYHFGHEYLRVSIRRTFEFTSILLNKRIYTSNRHDFFN